MSAVITKAVLTALKALGKAFHWGPTYTTTQE